MLRVRKNNSDNKQTCVLVVYGYVERKLASLCWDVIKVGPLVASQPAG